MLLFELELPHMLRSDNKEPTAEIESLSKCVLMRVNLFAKWSPEIECYQKVSSHALI